MILEIEDVCIKYYIVSEATVHWLSGWLKIIYIDLMCNQPFSTTPLAIFRQRCINNQNIHNINNHMCLSCVHDDMLNF